MVGDNAKRPHDLLVAHNSLLNSLLAGNLCSLFFSRENMGSERLPRLEFEIALAPDLFSGNHGHYAALAGSSFLAH